MSQENYLREQTRQQVQNNPHTTKVEPHEVPNDWARQVINSEIERQRAEQERRQRGY